MVDGANQAWQTIETENAKRGSGGSVTYDQIIPAAQSLTDYGKTVPASLDQITVLVSQLYRSWDRILVDMEIREGTDVTFHHKIKTVEVSIKDVANKTNETSEREEWKQISESEYKAMGKKPRHDGGAQVGGQIRSRGGKDRAAGWFRLYVPTRRATEPIWLLADQFGW